MDARGEHGKNAIAAEPSLASLGYVWPEQGLARIPDWVYTSAEVYAREVERIFHGRCWNYVALEAEIPAPGDFKGTLYLTFPNPRYRMVLKIEGFEQCPH